MAQTKFTQRADIVALENFAGILPPELRAEFYRHIKHFMYIGGVHSNRRCEDESSADSSLQLEYTVHLLKMQRKSKLDYSLVKLALDEIANFSPIERASFVSVLERHPEDILADIRANIPDWIAKISKSRENITQPSENIAEIILQTFNSKFARRLEHVHA